MRSNLLESGFFLLVGSLIGVVLQAYVFGRPAQQRAANIELAPGATSAAMPAARQSPAHPLVKATPTRATASKVPSKLVALEPVFDFGAVECGKIVDHTFVLKNSGAAQLTITKVKPDCGCAVPSLASKTVPAGGETKLQVKLNLSLQKGDINRAILIQSDEPGGANLQVRLVGVATSRVKLEPPRIDLAAPGDKDVPPSVIDVHTTDKLLLNVTGTRTSGENVQAAVEVVEPQKHFRVKITVKSPVAADFKGWVHLLTDDKGEYRVIGIPVAAASAATKAPAVAAKTTTPKKLSPALEVGRELSFTGPKLDGGSVDLAQYRGKPVVVFFWASWCIPCRHEMPAIKDLYEKYHKDGLEVIGVNLDKKTAEAEAYVKQNQLPWPNVHFRGEADKEVENPVAQKYGVREIPAILLLDSHGIVRSNNAKGIVLRDQVVGLLTSAAAQVEKTR